MDADGRQYSVPTAKTTARHASTPTVQALPCSSDWNSDGMNKINTAADTAIPTRLTTNNHVLMSFLQSIEQLGKPPLALFPQRAEADGATDCVDR